MLQPRASISNYSNQNKKDCLRETSDNPNQLWWTAQAYPAVKIGSKPNVKCLRARARPFAWCWAVLCWRMCAGCHPGKIKQRTSQVLKNQNCRYSISKQAGCISTQYVKAMQDHNFYIFLACPGSYEALFTIWRKRPSV